MYTPCSALRAVQWRPLCGLALLVIMQAFPAAPQALSQTPPVFSKTFTPATVGNEAVPRLIYRIDNGASGVAANNLAFVDTLPSGIRVPSSPNEINNCGGLLSVGFNQPIELTGGTVPAGATCTISVDISIQGFNDSFDSTSGDLTSDLGNSGSAQATLIVLEAPDPRLSFSPSQVAVGQTTTLTIQMANTSGVAITDLDFFETLPNGLEVAAVPNISNPCGGSFSASAGSRDLDLDNGVLGPMASCTISVDIVGTAIDNYFVNGVTLNGTFSGIPAPSGDFRSIGLSRTLGVVAPEPPSMSLSISPSTVGVGGTSRVNIFIRNQLNPDPAQSLSISDTSLSDLIVAPLPNISDTCGGNLSIQPGAPVDIQYTNGTVPPGTTCAIRFDVIGPTAGTKTYSASMTSSTGNDGPISRDLTVVPVGSLQLAKDFVDDPVLAGTTATLQFTITNTDGTNQATNISFTDDLNAALSGLTAVGPPAMNVCGNGSQLDGASLLSFTGGRLAAGASCTFAVTVQVPPNTSGSHTNTTSQITGTIFSTAVTGPAASATLVITDVVAQTQAVIRNFMSQRADLITSDDPRLTGNLNGSGGAGITTPFNLTASGVPGAMDLAVSLSLSQVARANAAQRAANRPKLPGAMGLGPLASAPTKEAPPLFDIWLKGTFADYRDTAGGVGEDGTFGLLYVGAEYAVATGLRLGLIAQFDWTDEEDDRTNISAEGQGWMVGPYLAARAADRVYVQARAAWGKSDNEVSPFGTYRDSFETSRWLASAKVEGRYGRGPWRISPIAGVIYYEDSQNGYTDSLGNLIAGQTASLGRATFGPEIGYTHEWENGRRLELTTEVTGIWDFDVEDRVVSALVVGADEVRAKVSGGVTLQGAGGVKVHATGFVDGLGADDFEAYGGNVKLGVPLN